MIRLTVQKKEINFIGEDIFEIVFQLAGSDDFSFTPGQFVEITLSESNETDWPPKVSPAWPSGHERPLKNQLR